MTARRVLMALLVTLPAAFAQTDFMAWRQVPQPLVAADADTVPRDIRTSGAARPGKPLTVILAGGSLRLPSGQSERRYLHQGSESGIQPGDRYLAFLYYERKNGEYFDCAKSWDLTTGVAEPTYFSDIRAAKDGKSRFAGMVEDNFITTVKDILSSAAK